MTTACTLFVRIEKKHIPFMHCWLKLSAHSKWLNVVANTIKTATITNVDEDGDVTKRGLAPAKWMARNRGRKWEEEKAANMMERFEDIMVKKEEACVKHNKV